MDRTRPSIIKDVASGLWLFIEFMMHSIHAVLQILMGVFILADVLVISDMVKRADGSDAAVNFLAQNENLIGWLFVICGIVSMAYTKFILLNPENKQR